MRNEVVLGILVIGLLMASCVPVAKVYVCPDGTKVNDAALCTPKEEAPEDVQTEPAPAEELPQGEPAPILAAFTTEARALVDKNLKTTGVQFVYFRSDNPNIENIYYASREKMKVDLETKTTFSPDETYDTIYLDLMKKSADGYCERASIQTCNGDRNKVYDVSYDLYFIESPYAWLDKLTSAELTGKSKLVDGRTVKEMNFGIGSDSGVMFIDSFFGIPIEISYEGVKYEFRNAVINELKPADLAHQTMNNI